MGSLSARSISKDVIAYVFFAPDWAYFNFVMRDVFCDVLPVDIKEFWGGGGATILAPRNSQATRVPCRRKSAQVVSMGKRKSRKQPPAPKAKPKLPTLFNCPFCNSEKSVTVMTDKERSLGTCTCGVCGATYCGAIHSLSDPVDVYCDWIDACEDANAE